MPPKRRQPAAASAAAATAAPGQYAAPIDTSAFSAPATKTELFLFDRPLEQNSIVSSRWVEINPTAALVNGGPVVFQVPASETEFTDSFNTHLHVKLKVVHRNDDSPMTADAAIYPTNNLLHSLFSRITLSLNGQRLGADSGDYPVVAFVLNTLNYAAEAKDSVLRRSTGFYKDTGTPHSVELTENPSLLRRGALIANSREVELYGKLFVDWFGQPRLIANGVAMGLTLERSGSDYLLLAAKTAIDAAATKGGYKIVLTKCTLVTRRVSLAVTPFLMINARLSRGEHAIYPFTTMETRTIQVPALSYSWRCDQVFAGALPSRVAVMLCNQRAHLGSVEHDPLAFENQSLNYLCFYRDGVPLQMHPFAPDYKNNNYLMSYWSMLAMLRTASTNNEIDISYEEYGKRFAMYGLDMTVDMSAASPTARGSLSLELRFAKSLPATTTCIVLGEFKRFATMDAQRNFYVPAN